MYLNSFYLLLLTERKSDFFNLNIFFQLVMKSIVRFVKGRVTGDVREMLPEIQQLVSMVYSHASLPVYTFLNDYIEKVDSSLDFHV